MAKSNGSDRAERRTLLKYLGVGGAVGLAGCSGGGDTTTQNTNDGGDGGTTQTTGEGTASGDVPRGGKPVIGLTNAPRGFNPLVISDSAAFAIMDQLFVYPTARDPNNPNETTAYGFSDWEFDPDTLKGTAKITEGLSWTDGPDFTAEDVAFTFNYLMENEGHRYEGNTGNLESLEQTGDYSIKFKLANETAAVFSPDTGVFAVPILPKHIWKDVDDYTKYSPDKIPGAGGFEWTAQDADNWYELTARPDAFPDELSEGPYVDKLRFLVYGDMTSLINGLKNGEVDLTYDSITPNRAFQLQDSDSVTVWNSATRGYNYIAYNMRRVPFDDKAFRQGLGFVYPFKYLVNTLRRGLSTAGDYAAANTYDPWRPDSFDEPIPHGPYKTESGELDVEKVRSFLENADGDHTYSFGSVKSSQVTGDKEIRIDGELLTDAHTDNDGNAGQGPLQMMMTPPSASPVIARACARFVENLNEVGIPTEQHPVAENSQTPLVWGQEDFDMWESGWVYMPKPHFYLSFWLASNRADMESNKEALHLNPMGYGNADDLIKKVGSTYADEKQKQYAKEALAQIYEDMPALITEYPNRLHASSNDYDGWIQMPGGISQNPWTYVNVHKKQ